MTQIGLHHHFLPGITDGVDELRKKHGIKASGESEHNGGALSGTARQGAHQCACLCALGAGASHSVGL